MPRKKNTDKTRYGHVLVLAGSQGMIGAAILTSRSSLESGAGLVTLGVPKSLESFIAKKSIPEAMLLGLPATKNISLDFSALKIVLSFIKQRNIRCVALGPGLSLDPCTQRFVRALVKVVDVPVVLDADGLNSFAGKAQELSEHHASLVMTPHAGEFRRIFSRRWPEDMQERKRLAKNLSKSYDVVLVLKSHQTLVVERDKIYMNHTGNPGMAKGGAGDVLTGIIAAFIAQGLEPFEAARWAVYFHGKAGDLAVHVKGELGLLASDIIKYLPQAFRKR